MSLKTIKIVDFQKNKSKQEYHNSQIQLILDYLKILE